MKVRRPALFEDVFALTGDAGGTTRFAAGATALQLEWAMGKAPPDILVDISALPGMGAVSAADDRLRIGACVTLNSLIADDRISGRLPMLHTALGNVAAPAVRNLATIGGNVAGRTGCLLPALLCLDAEVETMSAAGPSRQPLEDWLTAPAGDLIVAILLPCRELDIWTFRKIGRRAAFSASVINVAASLAVSDGRVREPRLAVGGGIAAPVRLHRVEAMLAGQTFDAIDWPQVHAALMAEIDAPDNVFRSATYRRRVAANALVSGLGGAACSFFSPSGRRWPEGPDEAVREAPTSYRKTPSSPRMRSALLPAGEKSEQAARFAQNAPDDLCVYNARTSTDEVTLSHVDLPDRWHIRPDVAAKVEGRFTYLTELRQPDMLVGRILRAGIPHALILSIDTSAAEALPGVIAVVTHRDVGGTNTFGIVVQDQPGLCADKVRYVGDTVAAVAAVDADTAERALALIMVSYAPLPVINGPEQALAPGAALVHETGNLQRELHFGRGDVDAAFAEAAHVVEDVYVTPRQMHGFMETEGGMAVVEADGTLTVKAGGQHGRRDRMQLARMLGMPEEKIRVVSSPTGGAFGGKDELTVQPALALLALKSRRPVRLHLTRAESVLAGQKRNPMTIRMKTACDAEGRLLALEVDVLAEAGAYASLGPGVLETAMEHAAGPYVVANVRSHGRLAYTNNGVCGAFRGFGANQMTFAIECQMDRMAAILGIGPHEIRARNLRQPGTPGYLGQAVAGSERIHEMLQASRSSPLWQDCDEPDGEWLIGTGMALNYQGNGLGSVVPDPAGGRLALTADGMIEGAFGLDEMGQGLLTLIKTSVADATGCGRDDVRPAVGDTARVPESGSTTASRGTSVVWASARMAAPDLIRQMLAAAGKVLDRDATALRMAPGGIAEVGSNSGDILLSYKALAASLNDDEMPETTVAYEFPKNDYSAGNARYLFAFGATLARVAVSQVTGEIRVLDLHQHTAAGPVMDVAAYLGQMEGGAVQGLGFTLTEDVPMQDGYYLIGNLDDYMMPGVADAPVRMKVLALETLDPGDELGPRGVGELGIGAVTPAIANAVADATGWWPTAAPFSPEAMIERLAARS